MAVRHQDLALTFKNGKLRLAGAKGPAVFRVLLEEVKEIQWRPNDWQVDFRVEDELYYVTFVAPQSERITQKNSFLLRFGAPGALLSFFLLYPHRKEVCELNLNEAGKWREILKNNAVH